MSPRGARVGFYQTLPGSDEIPYLIEERGIDPLTGLFDSDRALSAANVATGTFSSGGRCNITIATPTEGAGAYRVSASASLYGDSLFSATLTRPAAGSTTRYVQRPIDRRSEHPTTSLDRRDGEHHDARPV